MAANGEAGIDGRDGRRRFEAAETPSPSSEFRVLTRRKLLTLGGSAALAGACGTSPPRVVLTFDDAVSSHRRFVAPLLKDLGFRATFFVTHRWMADAENFMTWEKIAEIHEMGFEIGNHSWTHANFSIPRNAARLAGELALVENALIEVGVPKPVSFAWCGNGFGPEALAKLRDLGYRFARRGMQPETPYGEIAPGPTFDPTRHDPLLIPTTGDAYPDWTFEHFQQVLARADPGEIVVLQFHGVPDAAHPWVHTPPEMFRRYMEHLKTAGFETLALRDIEPYLARSAPPNDPAVKLRYPETEAGTTPTLPVEVEATRADLGRWMETMFLHHGFSKAEAAEVSGLPESEVETYAERFAAASPEPKPGDRPRVEPYPGGRHPRIGFLDGAIDPIRGTKASVFLALEPG